MSTHTPEPWRTVADALGLIDGVQMGTAGGFVIHKHANPEANARRIVACVNACAGSTNEELQFVASLGGFDAAAVLRWDQVKALTKQRDELLAELAPLALKFISGNCVSVDRATITADEWRPVAEAISKARCEHG